MTKEQTGVLLALIGGAGLLVAGVKLYVIGYYPDELVPFVALAFVAAIVCWIGSKLYQSGKQAS